MTNRLEKLGFKPLNPAQLAFVIALTSPPYPTVSDAGESAGLSRDYAYELHKKPHIQAAIRERCESIRRENERLAIAVVNRLGRRALEHNDDLGVQNAKVFLQGMGEIQGGVRIVTNVTAQAGQQDALEDRIRRIAEVATNDS